METFFLCFAYLSQTKFSSDLFMGLFSVRSKVYVCITEYWNKTLVSDFHKSHLIPGDLLVTVIFGKTKSLN